MTTVNNFYFYQLGNGDFYQFTENVVSIVQKEPATVGIIQTLKADCPPLLESYKKEQLTEETKQIVELDRLRDRAYMKIKLHIDGYTYDDQNPGYSQAANKLLTFVVQHGNAKLIRFDYNKETASISSLVSDVRNHAGNELDLLKLKPAVDFLEERNLKFKDFYATRGDAASVLKNTPPFYKLRREVSDHYRTMIADLESLQRFMPDKAAQIGDVITRLNVEIEKFKLLIPKPPKDSDTPTP